MEQKKIATAVDIMIKTASYEYVHITKYSEKNISYDNKDEMVAKEDEHSKDTVEDIIRTIRAIPEQMKKSTLSVVNDEAEKKIQKRIPEWLEVGPEPNIASSIANTAKKNDTSVRAEIETKEKEKLESKKSEGAIVEDLFEKKEDKKEEKKDQEVKKEEDKPQVVENKDVKDDFGAEDLFADDADLFK